MNAWTLAKKDLLIYCRDKTGLALGIGLPIVLALIFGTAMGAMGAGGGSPRVRLAVEDRDGSDVSRALVQALEDAEAIRVTRIELDEADGDPDESARGRVATGNAPAGLLIGAGFGADVETGADDSGSLKLFRDPSKNVEQQVLAGSLVPVFFEAFGDSLGRRIMRSSLRAFGFPEAGMESAGAVMDETWQRLSAIALASTAEPEAGAGALPDEDTAAGGFDFASGLFEAAGLLTEDVVGGDDAKQAMRIGQQTHSVAGIAVMMLLFGLVACGSTLREEQEEGTLDRLRLAGSDTSILAGKFLFTWLIGIAQLLILFVFALVVFDVPIHRELPGLVVLSAATAAAATGFGILFAATCESRKQVEGVSTLVILAMSAAGGSWFPLFLTPEWFQTLGHFTLNAWAMDGFHGLFLYERGLAGILVEVGVLCGIAVGTSLLAVLLWKRRLAV